MSTPNEYMFNALPTVDIYAGDGAIASPFLNLKIGQYETCKWPECGILSFGCCYRDYKLAPRVVKQLPFETPIGNMVAKIQHNKSVYVNQQKVVNGGTHYFIGSPSQAVWDKVDLNQLFVLRQNYVSRNPQTPRPETNGIAGLQDVLPDNVQELFQKYKTQLAVAAMLLLIILIIRL